MFRNLMFVVFIAGFSLNVSAVNVLGSVSCGSYISNINKPERFANFSWIAGFLSGMATESHINFVKGTDGESIRLWVENYCRNNPLKDTADAGYFLSLELAKSVAK